MRPLSSSTTGALEQIAARRNSTGREPGKAVAERSPSERPVALADYRSSTAAPTDDEPIPKLAGTHGLSLLRATVPNAAKQLSQEDALSICETSRLVIEATKPATMAEIGQHIEALALFYPVLRKTPEEQRLFVAAWASDLAGYPADLIGEACRQWRNSKAERFPTPGQLKALVERAYSHRTALARRAVSIIEQIAA